MRVALLLLLLLVSSLWTVADAVTLGVQKAHTKHYEAAEAAKTFQCLDGSRTIPFASVNNDVCDCPDGSDEPGTSACLALNSGVVAQLPENWSFQCTNKGFFEQKFSHSRVNDGICDCCDGSDELTSGVSCPNRCVEVEGELNRQLEAEKKRMQTAFANKEAMRADIMKHREQIAKALPAQKAERDQVLQELPALEEKNNALQKSLKEVREKLRAKYEEWEAGKDEREAAEAESSCVKWRQTGNCKPNGPRETRLDKNCDHIIPSKDSGFCECEANDAVDSLAEGADEEQGNEEEKEEKTIKYEFACGHPELTCLHVCDHGGEAAVGKYSAEPEDPDSYSTSEATAAEAALSSRRLRLAELEKSIEDATKTLNSSSPTTEELLRTLEGKTFTMDYQDYTYAVTMFQNVHQRDKGMSGGGTLLGNWKSFAENTYAMWAKDAYDLTQMLYADGTRCWNGVSRKTDIQLVCGPENKLTHIEEPAMCIYRMVFETPAMCDE